jgi:hypothetical protein
MKCERVDWYIIVFDRKTKLIYIVVTHNRMHSLKILQLYFLTLDCNLVTFLVSEDRKCDFIS